ncbi:MAG: glycosyltransferase family 2 protein [Patescibacteria group bacterium]
MLKISIITPSFNQGQFIEQTIQSVLSQNYPKLDYIVIDGGSTDGTIKILKKYGRYLRWISEKDKGQSHAINKGLKMASGDIIAWLNSDDYYLPGALNRVALHFERNKASHWVTGDYKIIDEFGHDIHGYVIWYKNLLRSLSSYAMLSFANYIIQPSTFWRRELMQKVGYLNNSYRYCMDYDLWLRFMKIEPPQILSSPLSAFRIHGASKGGSQYKKQFEEEIKVAQSHKVNKWMLQLHALHNTMINVSYSFVK